MLPLSQLIESTGVELKRRGKEQVGLCPFHDERTPSFSVNDAKGVYFCRGCNANGDVIAFYSHFYSLSPGQAIKKMASDLGIAIEPMANGHRKSPEKPKRPAPESWDRSVLLAINAAAQSVFYGAGKDDPIFAEEVANRAINSVTVEAFGLGYYPPALSIVDALIGFPGLESLTRDQLVMGCQELGLLYRDSEFSLFSGRLMFPITDAVGDVVGFSGRDLSGQSKAKYVNSPESILFDKSQLLYGVAPIRQLVSSNQDARSFWGSLTNKDTVYLVEGYTDVLALAQQGLRALAAMGTGLSGHQVRVLLRAGRTVICLYDGDQAGQAASRRAMLTLFSDLTDGHRLTSITLPENDDPDSFLCSAPSGEVAEDCLRSLPVVKPETIWWESYVGTVSKPPSLSDQVIVERAFADTATYPGTALWRMVLAQRVQQISNYRLRSPDLQHLAPPWFGLRFASTQATIRDHVLRLWLARFRRRPDLIHEFCSTYRHRWWVSDLLSGRAGYDEMPTGLVYIFAADYCLGASGYDPSVWPDVIHQLLDNGYPAHWLKGWLSAVREETSTISDSPQSQASWSFEWTAWMNSLDDSLHNNLIASLE